MSPSVEPFNEAKYKALMDGLECSEVSFSNIDLGDRFDAEYFTKEYLFIDNTLSKRTTIKLGELASTVASAFYPAATQLYSIGDMPFVRCVDCIDYPIMTKEQDESFEKIPYSFGKANKGISFIGKEDIIVTKVGTPCFATINAEYDEIALSRTVLGLTNIKLADPYYLMIFLRCKYGFEQLYRQRELTIQYQLTLPRVKSVNVFLTSKTFQKLVRNIGIDYITLHNKANRSYHIAEELLLSTLGMSNFTSQQQAVSVKLFSESYCFSGRLDAEYYHPKYTVYIDALKTTDTVQTICNLYDKNFIPCEDMEYNYIELANVGSVGNINNVEKILGKDLPSRARRQVKTGQVIVSSVEGSLQNCALITEEYNNSLCSTGFYVLDSDVLNSETLLILFKSDPIQALLKQRCSGTILTAIAKDELLSMPLPLIDVTLQREIAMKVQESFALRRQSEKLLEYAKRAVEIAIEQDEEAAMEWLKEKGVEC